MHHQNTTLAHNARASPHWCLITLRFRRQLTAYFRRQRFSCSLPRYHFTRPLLALLDADFMEYIYYVTYLFYAISIMRWRYIISIRRFPQLQSRFIVDDSFVSRAHDDTSLIQKTYSLAAIELQEEISETYEPRSFTLTYRRDFSLRYRFTLAGCTIWCITTHFILIHRRYVASLIIFRLYITSMHWRAEFSMIMPEFDSTILPVQLISRW